MRGGQVGMREDQGGWVHDVMFALGVMAYMWRPGRHERRSVGLGA